MRIPTYVTDYCFFDPTKLLIVGFTAFLILFHYINTKQKIVVGPQVQIVIPNKSTSLSFSKVAPKSSRIEFSRFEEISIHEVKNLILNAFGPSARLLLAPHLEDVLKYSEHYGIDPFWSLAVMWTESHFRVDAVSRVNAQGLMQVMPNTALYIGRILKKNMNRKVLLEYAKSPQGNIEFGIFYLSFLLKKFKGKHKLATVAYNMGPYWVSKRLRYKRPVGVKNLYLQKVNKSYEKITKTYKLWIQGLRKRNILLAEKTRWPSHENQENLFPISLTSQN